MQNAVVVGVQTNRLDFPSNIRGSISSPNMLGIPGRWAYTPSFDVKEVSVERWLRHKSPGTQGHYGLFMDRFLAWAEPRIHVRTPPQFFAWAESQPKVMLVQDMLEGFAETQKPTQRPYALSALNTYLERNGFERKLPRVEVDASLKQHHRGYRREEVIRLKSFLDDPLQKLYVDLLKDSGLRAGDALSIQYHHVSPDLEAGLEFCHVYFEPEYYPPQRKKKYAGMTFIGPNTVKELRELISQGRVSTRPDARLFPFSYTSLTDALRLARRKAGLDERLQPSHGLRKFFEKALDQPEPPLDDVKKQEIEGHSIGVRWNYRDQEVEELRPLYQRVYPYLDLSEEAVVDQRMKGVMEEVRSLREENLRLKSMEVRLETVEAQLAARVVYKPQLWPSAKSTAGLDVRG